MLNSSQFILGEELQKFEEEFSTYVGGEFLLKFLKLFPKDKLTAVEHAINRLLNFFTDATVLRLKINYGEQGK